MTHNERLAYDWLHAAFQFEMTNTRNENKLREIVEQAVVFSKQEIGEYRVRIKSKLWDLGYELESTNKP